MSDSSNLVQRIYAAFGEGNIAFILDQLADDVSWDDELAPCGVPWLTHRKGREEVASFFQSLEQLAFHQFEPLQVLEGEGCVACVVRVDLEVVATGKRIRDLAMHLWHFDNGKVTSFRHFVDTHQHVLALT
ncbi:MAG: nuclear transport factor 2 family protein [Acidobacteria bacterium]|nr:nuclear transport factor 2 family protein [Acidobacteriota bacterium]